MGSDPDRCLRDIAANGSFLRESAGTASTVVNTPSLFLLTDRQIKSAGTGAGEESLSIAINELAVSKRSGAVCLGCPRCRHKSSGLRV